MPYDFRTYTDSTTFENEQKHHHRSRFGGGGVRLGDPSSGPQLPASDSSSGGSDNEADELQVVVELFMWENGFSIDDGPLRTFDQPESRQFLESIMQGRVPDELLAARPRRRIDLRMQRRSGPYEPPKLKPFQGTGVRLGAVVPQVVSSAAPSSSSPAAQACVMSRIVFRGDAGNKFLVAPHIIGMDVTRVGTLVGTDKFGNKYYEDNSYFMPRNRWVEYPDKVWLDYDPTQIPPEWHRWLHHIGDDTPTQNPPKNEKWVLQHEENLSIFE
ncbi:SEP domain protein [Ancylostoma duodenale]|uniref:SEP domain protein n=1 Tax=Ancylostoma duodenale TaxID=51022 RepID=A0A0C2H292_9BILA|nr:SEP domain protein [Ancylostoma duodenale]